MQSGLTQSETALAKWNAKLVATLLRNIDSGHSGGRRVL